MTTLAVVPARGGSTELRRKNLLPIDGVPMFLRSARAAQHAGCQVVVSTDDVEIASTATVAGFEVHRRGPELADVVVDEVVAAAANGWDGPVLLVQPTVQPITADILERFIEAAEDSGTSPVSAGVENTHQLWNPHTFTGDWITQRVNRQDMTDAIVQELGIRWWHYPDVIGADPMRVLPIDGLVDIDTAADYRSITIPKRIVVAPLSDSDHGRGHLYRCLAIAERLQHHVVEFAVASCDQAARGIIDGRGWPRWTGDTYDLLINDTLSENIVGVDDGPVLSFEDAGNDAAINALYADGADWCVLRPEFLAGGFVVRGTVSDVMVMFGGTDPNNVGERVAQIVDDLGFALTWVRAGDDAPIAEMMHSNDMLITSAGRTVFEAAAVGIPSIVLAQNLRETGHTHLGYEHGNIYLGLADLVTDEQIRVTLESLAANERLRGNLSALGRPDGLGLDRIVNRIETMLKGLT